ncbi:hypothetical protein PBV87_19970 [Niameybacter massiliensis]|uniref:Uncharacterized protein n=1 Tax=Holtiella tumoricola TaxID=3018743 RepID=A0AA42DT00_9FIRM|nr:MULTISPECIES: hypothetical protein [Lachnospirales]MDA3733752.1 hypothetical protein [Holtiella tumoricola]
MNQENEKTVQPETVEPITYDEAFKKLGAFIQKTRKEEREQEAVKSEDDHA